MKKHISLISVFLILVFSIQAGIYVEASDNSNAISFSSVDELREILSVGEPCEVRFDGTSLDISSPVIITTEDVTIDLNGGNVNSSVDYPFRIGASDVSIKNGVVNNGGIGVYAEDAGGTIESLTLNNPPEHGILVRSGTVIGNIHGNTINNAGEHAIYVYQSTVSGSIEGNVITKPSGMGIRLYSQSECGDIASNVISGCKDHAIQLIGNSAASSNDGCAAGDIINNVITNCKGHGITVYHGSHCGKISGNKLANIGGANKEGDYGIIVSSRTPYKSYATEITYNEIDTVASAGIAVYSGPDKDTTGKWQDNGYIEGDIAYNTVKNAPSKNVANRVRASIYVDNHARVYGDIHDNEVDNSYFDGISVISYSYVRSIYNNTVSNANISGIAVKSSSVVTGDIYGNTIASAKEQGIMINNSSSIKGSIRENTISDVGINGISVTNSAKVNIISDNIINKIGKYGVIAGNKGKITEVSNNQIAVNSMKSGMGILSNTKCLISKITGNTITGKYLTGIRIKSPTAKVIIKNNTLKNSNKKGKRSTGISCESAKKLTCTGNKITGNKTGTGIYLRKCKGTVKKNTIKKYSTKISK